MTHRKWCIDQLTKEKSIYDKNTPHLNNNSSNGTYQNASKGTLSEKDSNVKNYPKNLGYHAGDLGKAEPLSIQSGDRGTGHFGTGT